MDIVGVLLLILLGGGGLFVGLIWAIVTGSARTARLRRLEQEQESTWSALNHAGKRIEVLERALGEAMLRLSAMRVEPAEPRPALASLPAPAPAPPAAKSEAPVAAREPGVAAPAPAAPAATAPEAPVEVTFEAAAAAPSTPAGETAAPEAPAPAPEAVAAPPPEVAAPVPEAVAAPPPEAAAPVPPAAPEAAVPEAAVPGSDELASAKPASAEPASAEPLRPRGPDARPEPRAESPVPPPPSFDWERWVGVRGAAALGACVLVIAGLYFFKYSIDNGLISPTLRVVLGVLVGLGGIAASELMLRRNYTVLANWLAGAGVAILYTAFWAAHGVYGLVGAPVSFGLMILVTAACGLLALRHEAMVIALLGLLGGFVTPVALRSGDDHPFGLFGYLLLLDGALLYLSHRRRWPVLAALSLLGTALYQAAWIGLSMGPERAGLGIGILVVFGGVYAFASPRVEDGESELWKITRAATVLLPFLFGLYFGLRGGLGERMYPLALMLAVVSAGAAWIGRARAVGWAAPVAAIGGTTSLGAWLLNHDGAAAAWEVSLCVTLLAAVFHAFLEIDAWRPREGGRAPAARAAAVAGLGALFCLVAQAVARVSVDPWPWIAGWMLLGGLVVRQSLFPERGALRLGLGILVCFGFALVHLTHADVADFPADRVYAVALLVITGLGLLSAAMLARASSSPGAPPSVARSAGRARRGGGGADAVAALLPFLPALYFASRGGLGPHLVPLALAITALAAGATRAARARDEAEWATAGAAVAGLAVLATWIEQHLAGGVAWEASIMVCVFAAAFHVFVEIAVRREEPLTPLADTMAALTAIAAIGLLAIAATAPACSSPWPWLAGWVVLGAMALRQLGLPGRERLHPVLAVVLGLAFPVVQGAHALDFAFPSVVVWMGAAIVTAAGVTAASFLHRGEGTERASRWAGHGAALLAILLLVGAVTGSRAPAPPAFVFGSTLALTVLALVSAARLGAGGWSLAAAMTAALVHTVWVLDNVGQSAATAAQLSAARVALAGQGLSVVVVAAWPLLAGFVDRRGPGPAGERLRKSAWAWRASALAAPLWFPGLCVAWISAFGKGAVGALPVALGAVTLGVAWRAASRPDGLPAKGSVRLTALVWLCGVTLAAISLAIPIQLSNEWVTVGWALEGVALLALWRRLDHAGLKYTAIVHLGVAVVRLVANPWVLEYHPRASVPVLNWLAYTYWIPVLALLGAWWLLRELEVPRGRSWEAGLYVRGRSFFAVAAGAAAVAVFFVWINLTIFDAWSTGPRIEVAFERLPARDLTLSLAWALYALFLLAVGIVRRSAALRWTSLMLILITVGKVFLWDLRHLHDLYRVMSLVGLALSLILIALAYQRFVFGKRAEGRG